METLEKRRNAELDPFIRDHEAATKPIHDKFDAKIWALRNEAEELQVEVINWLKAQDKVQTIECERAIASLAEKDGPRKVDPKKFFDAVKTKGAEFWNCLKVEIGKASKFMGDSELNKIAEKEVVKTGSIKLKG